MTFTISNSGNVNGRRVGDVTHYEEAILLAGHGRFHYFLFLGSTLSLFVLAVECDLMPYLLPASECDFKISSTEKGILTAIVYIGMICGCHLWGFIADTTGRRKVILLTLFLDMCCTLASSFMPSFVSFIITRFLSGFCISGLSVATAYLGEFHSARTKTKALLWMCVSMPLASTIMPGLAWLVIPQPWSFPLPWVTFSSWRFLVLLCTIPPLLTIAIFWYLPESPKLLLVLGREEEALQVLRNIFATNTGKRPEEFPVKAVALDAMDDVGTDAPEKVTSRSGLDVARQMWSSTKQLFLPPYLMGTALVCAIQFGVFFTYAGFYTWLPELLNRMAEFHAVFPNQTATFCGAIVQLQRLPNDNYLRNEHPAYSDVFKFINKSAKHFATNQTKVLNLGLNPVVDFAMNRSDDLKISSVNVAKTLYSVVNMTSNTNVPLSGTLGGRLVPAADRLSMENLLTSNETECSYNFEGKAFQDTLIIAVASAIAYVLVGFIIKYVTKKCILVSTLTVSGGCATALYFVTVPAVITALPGIFIVLSSVGYSVMNAVVVDMYPTQLRAMAVGMSLTAGRLGPVACSVLLGCLIDAKCELVIFLSGGIATACGLISLLLPRQSKR